MVRRLFFIILPLSFLYFFSYPGVDPDLWGHLLFGREILRVGGLPDSNLYSYTAPAQEWINHEWLADVIFFSVYRLLGSPGLMLLKLLCAGGAVYFSAAIIRKQTASAWAQGLSLIVVMAILSPGFNVRPQIFTYLLFSLFLFLLYRYEEKDKRALYWAPPLMALWVNLHGGFVAGLGALGLFSLWTSLREWQEGERLRRLAMRILFPLELSILALWLNPYGMKLLDFLASDLLLDRPITEWAPISFWGFSFLEFKLAVLLVLVAGFWRRSFYRWNFHLALLAALFAMRYQRHTPLFAIAAAPFVAQGMEWLLGQVKGRAAEWALAAGVFLIGLFQFYSIGQVRWQHGLRLVVDPLEYPTQAADFLQRNGMRGNLAVPFDWGEYLIWKLYPDVRVSIDGRYTTAYPEEVIEDQWEWMSGGKRWRRLLDRYSTDIAMTKRGDPVTSLLRQDPEWVYIYSDPVAFIFVRKTLSQQGLLAAFADKQILPPVSPPVLFPG